MKPLQALIIALALTGCATFQRAQSDIPGTVMAGLNVTACVTAAVRDEQDLLAREAAIGKCFADAFAALTKEERARLVAQMK